MEVFSCSPAFSPPNYTWHAQNVFAWISALVELSDNGEEWSAEGLNVDCQHRLRAEETDCEDGTLQCKSQQLKEKYHCLELSSLKKTLKKKKTFSLLNRTNYFTMKHKH